MLAITTHQFWKHALAKAAPRFTISNAATIPEGHRWL